MGSAEKGRTLLESAVNLAHEANALAIVSFIPIPDGFASDVPLVNVIDQHPEFLLDNTMMALLEYCSKHVLDSAVQYRIATETDAGKVVAVFPSAILIYDLESSKDEFTVETYADIASSDVIYAVLSLALEIAHDGREGQSIGTAFIIGDTRELMSWSHQGVLNPYAGHPKEVRDITKKENWESVKEFSQLDGAFIVDRSGIIEACGRYLDADARQVHIQSGLGGRHLSAAAITKVTSSIAIVVSESGGIIRVLVGGRVVSHIRTDIRLHFCS